MHLQVLQRTPSLSLRFMLLLACGVRCLLPNAARPVEHLSATDVEGRREERVVWRERSTGVGRILQRMMMEISIDE